MITEVASTVRQIGQEIRYRQLQEDFAMLLVDRIFPVGRTIYGGIPLFLPVSGHSLASIRNFKGL